MKRDKMSEKQIRESYDSFHADNKCNEEMISSEFFVSDMLYPSTS